MEQGSPEWLALRVGKITGSRFKAVMDLNKRNGQPNKPRRELVRILRDELATGVPEYVEPNEYMAHGSAMEPFARAAYEFAKVAAAWCLRSSSTRNCITSDTARTAWWATTA